MAPDLDAWVRFLRAHAAITRQLSARLEADHGLTLSDYDVLVQLYYAPERALRRVDLARTVLLTASGITRLLDGLERCGWVEKKACSRDARVSYAALTTAGVDEVRGGAALAPRRHRGALRLELLARPSASSSASCSAGCRSPRRPPACSA